MGGRGKGEKRKYHTSTSQRRALYLLDELETLELVRFDWQSLTPGSDLHRYALEALEFGKRALALNEFQRGDYKRLCELFVFYLGGDIKEFKLHQPGACHEARFMADALYILTLKLTEKATTFVNDEQKGQIKTAALFVSIFYAPWFLKSYLPNHASNNDLQMIKQAYSILTPYPSLGKALLDSMKRHSWYLSQSLVVMALADDDVENQVKKAMMERMLLEENQAPVCFDVGKPELPTVSEKTALPDLIGPQSWFLLQVAGVDRSMVEAWSVDGEVGQSFTTLSSS